MASPFNTFRKNRKMWFAFLAVVCMITFVLVPSSVRVGCGRSRHEEYAVETKSHSLTRGELQRMAQQRERADAFANLLDLAAKSPFEPRGFRVSISSQVNRDQPLREAFDTWLKVQKAKDLGIEVSQDDVTEYIKARSGGALSTQAMGEFLRQHSVSEPEIYGALANEILAQRVDELYGFVDALPEISPAERKELWDRQNRRAHAEVVELKVEDFAALVPEPTDEKLKEFFELRRNRLPNPESPEPGFRLPYLARFQYLSVSQPRLYEAAMKAITDAEISQHYDELVKAKNNLGGKLTFKEEEWKRSLPSAEKEGEKKEPGKAATEKPATPEKPKTDAKSDGSGAAAAPRHGVGSRFRDEEIAPQSQAYSSRNRLPTPFSAGDDASRESERRASYPVALAQADPAAKTADKTPADAKIATDAKTDAKTEKQPEPAKTGDTTKTGDKAEPSKTEAPKFLDPFKTKTPERRLDEIFGDLTIPDDIRELPPGRNPPEFKPLWAVETVVREDLAQQMANRDAKRLVELLKAPLEQYSKDYDRWTRKKTNAPPASPLADTSGALKVIDEGFAALATEKRAAWKKSFEERKKVVDEKIDGLTKEKQLTPEGFKKLAADSKNEEWQKWLAEQQQLADVEKRAADTLAAWQAPLSKKRTNLEPETTATTPEKKEESKTEKEAAGTKGKTAKEAAKDNTAKDNTAKDNTAKDNTAKDNTAKDNTAKPTEKKDATGKKEGSKEAPGKSAKTADAEKKTGDGKKDDGKTVEPTDPVVSLQTTAPGPTGHGLDARDFRRQKDPLARAQLADNPNFQDFMSGAFESAKLFEPKLASASMGSALMASASDDHYLFWKIDQRPTEVLQWEDPRTREVVEATREQVLKEYRKYEARALVLKRARELAEQIGREARDFPVEEVLRLFRLEGQGTLSAPDRKSLTLAAFGTPEVYAVVAEVFEDGKSRAVEAPAVPRDEPLEAPPPLRLFSDLEQARQQATQLAAEQRKPSVLVIVGKSIGQDKSGWVFQGLEGFRWQPPEKGAPAADEIKNDETKNVVRGPGRLAGRIFPLKIGSGDSATTLSVVGKRVDPFTWDQLRPLGGRGEDDPGVAGLVVPGEVFGETTFKLQPGELGAALNQPETIAYVVQVTGYDYSVLGSVYPADGTLEKSPLRDVFLAECRQAVRAEEQFPQEIQQYRQLVAQFPQFARIRPPPRMPVSLTYRSIRAVRQYQSWREGLYKEYDVHGDENLDSPDRS